MQHLRSKAIVLGVAVAAAGALFVWRSPWRWGWHQSVEETGTDGPLPEGPLVEGPLPEGPGEIDGRAWVEKRPEKLTEYVHVAIFVSRANFALFERASSYDVHFELADVSRKDDKVSVYFPQSGRSATVSFKVKSCSDLPPFDLCLDLSDNPWGGPKRYYGFSQPDDESSQLGELAGQARRRAIEGSAHGAHAVGTR
jgi:hypothetical protein